MPTKEAYTTATLTKEIIEIVFSREPTPASCPSPHPNHHRLVPQLALDLKYRID
jgi:hypothetical protein